MQTITPFLYFDSNAEEAVNFYVSVFKNSSIHSISRYSEAGPRPTSDVMTISFHLNGQEFIALNGGPEFKFSPAISFMALCETQEEIDELWDRLSDGGQPIQCGWLTDKFGVTWQVTPRILMQMIQDKDPVKAANVAKAMFEMVKLDIAALQRAYDE